MEQDLLATYPTLASLDELAQKFQAMKRETDPRVQGRLDELAEHGTPNLDDWLFMPILTSLKTFCDTIHDRERPIKAPGVPELHFTLVDTIHEGGSPIIEALGAPKFHITIHDGELPFIKAPGASKVHIDRTTLAHRFRNQIDQVVLADALTSCVK